MDWIKIVLLICIIIQEVQILFLRRDIIGISDILGAMLSEHAKKVISIVTDKDGDDD